MRRVLIDECLPVQLHRWLAPLDARTVEFQGGQGLRNGELLARATGTFDVLLTVDALLACPSSDELRQHPGLRKGGPGLRMEAMRPGRDAASGDWRWSGV
jgi:hypothetical protein